AGTLCWASGGAGAALVGLGYGQAAEGGDKLFATSYTFGQASRVDDSFNVDTFPGEQNPALDLAKDAGLNLLLFGAGAGAVKGMAYLEDALAGTKAVTVPEGAIPDAARFDRQQEVNFHTDDFSVPEVSLVPDSAGTRFGPHEIGPLGNPNDLRAPASTFR